MNIKHGKVLLLAGFAAVSLTLAGCDDAKNGSRDNGGSEDPAPEVSLTDRDLDKVDDSIDNCPGVFNPADILVGNQLVQRNTDRDGQGDACDQDDDNDGLTDGADSCPLVVGTQCSDDVDGDNVRNDDDNCRTVPNPDRKDTDADGLGDACDDSDSDGFLDFNDSCPTTFNPGTAQTVNTDGKDTVDACDTDKDNDGVADSRPSSANPPAGPFTPIPSSQGGDNCPFLANAPVGSPPKQPDADNDGIGDACDGDADGDGVSDDTDNCPFVPNPIDPLTGKQPNFNEASEAAGAKQGDACEDFDEDRLNDDQDFCPEVPLAPGQAQHPDNDKDRIGDACDNDDDNDNVLDGPDNCDFEPNTDQKDTDGDGVGDACSADPDGDGVIGNNDKCPLVASPSGDLDGCPDPTDIRTGYTCTSGAPAGSTVTAIKTGGLCQLGSLLLNGSLVDICGVSSPASAADGNLDTFSSVTNSVALADGLFTDGALTGQVGVEVSFASQQPANSLAAFVVRVPRSLVELSLGKGITVTTDGGEQFGGLEQTGGFALELLNNGYDGNTDPLGVDNLTSQTPKYVIGGYATRPFSKLSITVGGALSVDLGTSIEVYDTCSDLKMGAPATGISDGSLPLPGADAGLPLPNGDDGLSFPMIGDNNPLEEGLVLVTEPLGAALTPLTSQLDPVADPLTEALNDNLGDTPLSFVAEAADSLLNGTGDEPSGPEAMIMEFFEPFIAAFENLMLGDDFPDAPQTAFEEFIDVLTDFAGQENLIEEGAIGSLLGFSFNGGA